MRYLRNAFVRNLSGLLPGPAETFSKDWPSKAGWTDEDLVIDEVFYRFDEPLFFSVKAGPMLLILQKAASRHGNLYFGSVVAPEVVEAMTSNRVSVRAAMTAGPVYVLEMDGMQVTRHWNVAAASIPASWWPTAGTCLSDHEHIAGDTPSFSLGRGGLRLSEGKAQSGDGRIDVKGVGFSISLDPDAAPSLWAFVASLLPQTRRVRHRKRGSDYDIMNEAVSVQCAEPIKEGDVLCVYVEEDGKGWARPRGEFNDGRFETL
ncbi:hypothetical protein OIU34_18180 [Pararhizobium sp. BT-229]|uniref:hypothetical protein n=1 Tax=Pararhizobium sp. BT-229 TaxID=2986923 RepID=UPI0021F6D49B|nr:hypothetical protein [Pararhizobium sp. BT-229]MCV9963808.1 hypothetical protein [Pararhizobium sp. BT-229]